MQLFQLIEGLAEWRGLLAAGEVYLLSPGTHTCQGHTWNCNFYNTPDHYKTQSIYLKAKGKLRIYIFKNSLNSPSLQHLMYVLSHRHTQAVGANDM